MAALPVVAWSAAAPSGSNRHVGREGTRAAWRRTCSRGDGGRRGNLPPKKMVRASHLLIKHAESRNPVSRRTNESTSGMSKEAARAELQKWIDTLNEDQRPLPEKFAALAAHRSDCGSYKQVTPSRTHSRS